MQFSIFKNFQGIVKQCIGLNINQLKSSPAFIRKITNCRNSQEELSGEEMSF